MDRYLKSQILEDLGRKMVFLAGPRQVGKTTLSKRLISAFDYLNWDIDRDRTKILEHGMKPADLWIFDEIHKYRSWRNYLKGLFDEHGRAQKILVTGSARLDVLRRGGDSLQGRYHFLRLHPFSLAEIGGRTPKDLETLFRLSGFPEPFLSGSEKQARRWSGDYGGLLVRHEIAGQEGIQDLGNLELLYHRLPDLVGSPLSINALREDLRVAHKTVERWLDSFERFYGLFRIAPFGGPKLKAIKKAQKHYYFDWNQVNADGPRFENLVACALLKWTHWQNDAEGRPLELRYFRDLEDREVDFLIADKSQPIQAIECKLSDEPPSKALKYLLGKYPKLDARQIALRGRLDKIVDGVRLQPAADFLSGLI